MATIRKLESGMFQAVVRKTGHPPRSQTFKTKTAAREWATRCEGDIDAGRSHGPAYAHRLSDLINTYKAGPLLTLKAQADRVRMIDFWGCELGDHTLAGITPTKIAEVLREFAARPIVRKIRKGGNVVDVESSDRRRPFDITTWR